MTCKEAGFRPFYHKFCIIPMTTPSMKLLARYPNADRADGILTYGYCDSSAGFTLEVLAIANNNDNCTVFDDISNDQRFILRFGTVANDVFQCIDDPSGTLAERYKERINDIHTYYRASDPVETSRSFTFLDSLRHENFIDDILVLFYKETLQPEGCWVRIKNIVDLHREEHAFVGILLNEPNQDFGCHRGEEILFFTLKNSKNQTMCISSLN